MYWPGGREKARQFIPGKLSNQPRRL